VKTRFDDKLQLKSAGRHLQACGPLEWDVTDGPPGNGVTITVTVTQGNVLAQGTSTPCTRPAAEWMIELRPGPGEKFDAGPAHAIGTLTVTDPADGATFSWQGAPTLTFDRVPERENRG
jgi:hypothetical protein